MAFIAVSDLGDFDGLHGGLMESKAEFVAKPERYCSIVVPAL
jgi:hypothetical protein